jgi:hypothetical protein
MSDQSWWKSQIFGYGGSRCYGRKYMKINWSIIPNSVVWIYIMCLVDFIYSREEQRSCSRTINSKKTAHNWKRSHHTTYPLFLMTPVVGIVFMLKDVHCVDVKRCPLCWYGWPGHTFDKNGAAVGTSKEIIIQYHKRIYPITTGNIITTGSYDNVVSTVYCFFDPTVIAHFLWQTFITLSL